MTNPKLSLNRLPKASGTAAPVWFPHQWRPGAHALGYYVPTQGDPDPELVAEAMYESLLAGLADLQGGQLPPLLDEDARLRPIFAPTPGRCLWTLATLSSLDQVRDDPGLLDPTPLLNLALKPSHSYPRDLQGITPRMGLALTGMRTREFLRFAQWLAEQGWLAASPQQADTYTFFSTQGYGATYDARLETLTLGEPLDPVYLPPRNSRRSNAQHQALVEADRQDVPLPALILAHPPYKVDLGPDLHRAFGYACDKLRDLARQGQARGRGTPYLHEVWSRVLEWDLYRLEAEVVRDYLLAPWDFVALHNEALSPQEHVKVALLRTLAQHLYRASGWRYQQPHTALAVSLASGISPAIFAQAAIDQLARTGVSYLGENHIDTIAQHVRSLPKARSPGAQALREELLAELDELTEDYLAVADTLPPSRVLEAESLRYHVGLPAWGVGDEADTVEEEED